MTSGSIKGYALPKDINKLIVLFFLVFMVWVGLVYEPLLSAINIWIGNEIYNHCLIVIPASIYLIYERRHELNWSAITFSRFAIVIFILQLVFYVLSTAAGIQLFQHIAIFSMLPTLVWMFIGTKLAWQIRFPLVFVLFAVPVGEELVPFLQEITADLSVFLLDITGIPLFRSGLYIEIPQGKFLVAEACSGVSFLIASIVLGNLYANMYLVSWRARISFVVLSVIFPILANAVRVYGIIYIGYASDMKHAVGADHLIYGWFFFAFVLICLFLIGELIRKREKKWLSSLPTQSNAESMDTSNSQFGSSDVTLINKRVLVFSSVVVIFILASIFQINRMSINADDTVNSITVNLAGYNETGARPRLLWEPTYVRNTQEKMMYLTDGDLNFELYHAFFNGSKGELVSSLHRLYNQDRWTLVDRKRLNLGEHRVISELVTSSVGIKKEIIYWYWVDGEIVDNFNNAKLIEFKNKLKGKHTPAIIFAVGVNMDNSVDAKVDNLSSVAKQLLRANLNIIENED